MEYFPVFYDNTPAAISDQAIGRIPATVPVLRTDNYGIAVNQCVLCMVQPVKRIITEPNLSTFFYDMFEYFDFSIADTANRAALYENIHRSTSTEQVYHFPLNILAFEEIDIHSENGCTPNLLLKNLKTAIW